MGLAQYQGNIHNKSSVLQTESSSQCSKLTERPRNNMNTYKEAKDERKERRIEKDKDTLRTDNGDTNTVDEQQRTPAWQHRLRNQAINLFKRIVYPKMNRSKLV